MKHFPDWLKKPRVSGLSALTSQVVSNQNLHTVCQSARCPNRSECWGRGTATFMILGDVCTRDCKFCAVSHGTPGPIDTDEPERVAEAAEQLGLAHVVVTSTTRDDLEDGGAEQFCRTIRTLRRVVPEATVEVLTPDFNGNERMIERVCEAVPDVFNHNVETVERLTPAVRSSESNYRRSLGVIRYVKRAHPKLLAKSGLMVGLGEKKDEVMQTFRDLRAAGCDLLTVGQYLQPSAEKMEVKEFVPLDDFEWYEEEARKLGFHDVFCRPFVRSSYHAEQSIQRALSQARKSHDAD